MKTKAAVAWAPKQPLSIEEIDIMGPKAGEVLLKVHASGVCHTDAFTLSGDDPEASFPCVLGHEGGCEVVELGDTSGGGNQRSRDDTELDNFYSFNQQLIAPTLPTRIVGGGYCNTQNPPGEALQSPL